METTIRLLNPPTIISRNAEIAILDHNFISPEYFSRQTATNQGYGSEWFNRQIPTFFLNMGHMIILPNDGERHFLTMWEQWKANNPTPTENNQIRIYKLPKKDCFINPLYHASHRAAQSPQWTTLLSNKDKRRKTNEVSDSNLNPDHPFLIAYDGQKYRNDKQVRTYLRRICSIVIPVYETNPPDQIDPAPTKQGWDKKDTPPHISSLIDSLTTSHLTLHNYKPQARKEQGTIAFLSAIISLVSGHPNTIQATHDQIFSPLLQLTSLQPRPDTTAGILIAGTLLKTTTNMEALSALQWEDPMEGLNDTAKHLPGTAPDYLSLTQITTTSFIEMWANSLLHPETTLSTPEQVTEVAIRILQTTGTWPLERATLHGTTKIITKPWPIYFVTHVIMMATYYFTEKATKGPLTNQTITKLVALLKGWITDIGPHIHVNIELYCEIAICLLNLDPGGTEENHILEIARKYENDYATNWGALTTKDMTPYTKDHVEMVVAWMISWAKTRCTIADATPTPDREAPVKSTTNNLPPTNIPVSTPTPTDPKTRTGKKTRKPKKTKLTINIKLATPHLSTTGSFHWQEIKVQRMEKTPTQRGVYASQKIPKGLAFPIAGYILTRIDALERMEGIQSLHPSWQKGLLPTPKQTEIATKSSHVYTYRLGPLKGLTIDGKPQGEEEAALNGLGITMMINEPSPGRSPNCIIHQDLFLVTKDLKEGTELLAHYNNDVNTIRWALNYKVDAKAADYQWDKDVNFNSPTPTDRHNSIVSCLKAGKQLIPKDHQNYPRKDLSHPRPIPLGLPNPQNHCFLNALIQLIYSSQALQNILVSHTKTTNTQPIIQRLVNIMQELTNNNQEQLTTAYNKFRTTLPTSEQGKYQCDPYTIYHKHISHHLPTTPLHTQVTDTCDNKKCNHSSTKKEPFNPIVLARKEDECLQNRLKNSLHSTTVGDIKMRCTTCSPNQDVPFTRTLKSTGTPPPFLLIQIPRTHMSMTKGAITSGRHQGRVTCPAQITIDIGSTRAYYRRKAVILHVKTPKLTVPYNLDTWQTIDKGHYLTIRDEHPSLTILNDDIVSRNENPNLLDDCARVTVGAIYDLLNGPQDTLALDPPPSPKNSTKRKNLEYPQKHNAPEPYLGQEWTPNTTFTKLPLEQQNTIIINRIATLNKENKGKTEIRKSNIKDLPPSQDMGVFTCKHINKGEQIEEYIGVEITGRALKLRYPKNNAEYAFKMGANKFIDAIDPRDASTARWINGGKDTEINVEAKCIRGEIRIYATQPIQEGEELIIDYDPNNDPVNGFKLDF